MFFSISSVDELLICIHVPSCWIFWQFQLFKRWYFFWEGLSVSWRFISKLQWFTGRPVCLVAICHKNMNIEFFARGCLLLLNKMGVGIYYLWTSLLFLKVIKLRSFVRSLWIKPPQMKTKIHYHNVLQEAVFMSTCVPFWLCFLK